MRQVRNVAKKLMVKLHNSALRTGVVVLPNHYYTPIADVHDLARTRKSWARRSSMLGIDADMNAQASRLKEAVLPFEPEYRTNRAFKEGQSKGFGPGFGYVEAQCLHGVLRWLKPKRMIEVGSGVSTYCALQALALNAAEGRPGKITCIEPYPSDYIKGAQEVDLVARKVQELDPADFDSLAGGDLLSIDSSHAIRPGGDVLYLYLEVLPRLKPGCIIHIHDVFFPYVFQRNLLTDLFQHMETALLQALMTNNSRLEIVFSLSMLHYDERDIMRAVFPEYNPAEDVDGLAADDRTRHFPSSIYLRVRG